MNEYERESVCAIREVSVEIKAVLEWLKSHANLATKHDLKELELKIMATQSEIAAQLKQFASDLGAVNDGLQTATTEIAKVGTETDGLNQKIKDLTDAINSGGAVSQEVTDAVAALQTSVDAIKTSAGAASAAVQAVDAKVPDAPTP
jgi:uncharacterized protein YoxC